MAERKITPTARTTTKATTASGAKKEVKRQRPPLFEKDNYKWMIIGGVVIAIGMFLMAGGKNESPDQFDYNKVYASSRITIAPILILAGFMIEIFAIFKRPKVQH